MVNRLAIEWVASSYQEPRHEHRHARRAEGQSQEAGRSAFVAFLKGFVALKVMQTQISMVDTETLLDARRHPEKWPNLMVKVAGYSARFVDLSEIEKDELIGRSLQRVGA